MAPAIDLKKIDWNFITDTRSLFESVLAMLKSRDEENVTLRKDIERLREEAEAIAGDHMMLTALFIFGDLEHLVFESELYGSCPESCGTAVRK